ncbi:disease resistance protein rpm1 [Hordeum vulgare]|nr:disease resistance protein rpm1 [Hordeum vulgare]
MPLPPRPALASRPAAQPRVAILQRPLDAELSRDPDLESPSRLPSRSARSSSSFVEVLETPLAEQQVQLAHAEAEEGVPMLSQGIHGAALPVSLVHSSSRPASREGAESREGVDATDDWHFVRPHNVPRRPALATQAFKPGFKAHPIPSWLKGRCCLAPGHRASGCRDPICCSRCLENHHRARDCRNKWRPLSRLSHLRAPPPLPRPAAVTLEFPAPRFGAGRGWPLPPPQQAVVAAPMARRLGEAASRPEVDFVVVPATPEMQQESALLSSNAVVAWLKGARSDVSTAAVAAAFPAKDWWVNRSNITMPNHKARASLTMLISWVIWNERNARVFRNKFTPTTTLLNNIKIEARLWVAAGAKKLGNIILGE